MQIKRFAPKAMLFYWLKDFTMTFEQLEDALSQHMFKGCSGEAISSRGFVHALDRDNALLDGPIDDCPVQSISHPVITNGIESFFVSLLIEEKQLPTDEVLRRTKARVKAIEKEDLRIVRPSEMRTIKTTVKIDMAKDAFSKFKRVDGLIMPNHGMLVVFTGSGSVADIFTTSLRKAIGSLKCVPMDFVEQEGNEPLECHNVMAQLVENRCKGHSFELGESVSLQGEGKIVYRDVDIDERVQNILEDIASGARVEQLEINIPNLCSFCISGLNVLTKIHWASIFPNSDDIECELLPESVEEETPQSNERHKMMVIKSAINADAHIVLSAILEIKASFFNSIGRKNPNSLKEDVSESLGGDAA